MTTSIRPLGDPALRRICSSVHDFSHSTCKTMHDELAQNLRAFQNAFGFGRGISAPQLGFDRRIVIIDSGPRTTVLVNPEIVEKSPDKISLWDDCMCFPELLVRLERWQSISVEYFDLTGKKQVLKDLDPPTAELLQHEIDHLDGILAVDRALDRNSIISRAAYEADRGFFDSQVDLVYGSRDHFRDRGQSA